MPMENIEQIREDTERRILEARGIGIRKPLIVEFHGK
jgi:hypothetical protein